MHFKHAFITCLLVFILHIAATSAVENPDGLQCEPPEMAADGQKKINIMYLVDKFLDPDTQVPGKDVKSSDVLLDLYREITDKSASTSTPCERFSRALGRAPAPFLDRENVHFIVPMLEDKNDPTCFLKAFQAEFKDDLRKKNFYFNGILINSGSDTAFHQAVRVVVPDLTTAVNTSRTKIDSFRGVTSEEKKIVMTESDELIDNLTDMVEQIVSNRVKRDWEEILTSSTSFTSQPPNTSTSSLVSTTDNSTSTSESSTETILNSTTTSSESTTTQNTTPTSSESTILNTTTTSPPLVVDRNEGLVFLEGNVDSEFSNTTVGQNATTAISYSALYEKNENEESSDEDYDGAEAGEDLEMASGLKNGENNTKTVIEYYNPSELEHRHKSIDANLLIYVLLLLLLIWLFCIFLCLVWMFYCAKKRKNKLIDHAEEQSQLLLPLLEKGPPEPVTPKPSISTESDEDDAEWNNIKPAIYTDSTAQNQSKSEVESVKQPSKEAQFAPVEVSELEENKEDDITNRPRRAGYLAPKRTSDFRFD
ncbi:hypothetical protein CRE_28274 [Caenorhabditis remanei]|uniref:Uncharacterized protein n=1 Tax=Caenorhabditis remanei TaxID=31234 RepID=E3LN30_CAERE|nr:hypothetical protein CRE_28274 [Caenorhabditis remanei]